MVFIWLLRKHHRKAPTGNSRRRSKVFRDFTTFFVTFNTRIAIRKSPYLLASLWFRLGAFQVPFVSRCRHFVRVSRLAQRFLRTSICRYHYFRVYLGCEISGRPFRILLLSCCLGVRGVDFFCTYGIRCAAAWTRRSSAFYSLQF